MSHRVDQGRGGASKLLGLELVRFACAFAVLVWHYQHFYEMAGAPAFVRADQPLHGPLALFYGYGLFGVQLFWGISGFIFFWKYGQAIADQAVDGAKFFWLRFSRLYPLHIVTLLLVAGLQPLHVALTGESFVYQGNTLPNFLAQLGMATHWGASVPYTFNGPIWSVSAEIFVYALFFLLVRRFGPSWALIGGAVGVSLAAQFAGAMSPALVCTGYFFAGGAAAKLFLQGAANGTATRDRQVAAMVLAAVLGSSWWTGQLANPNVLPFVLLVAMPPLLLLAAQDWTALDHWQRPIQAAGNLTYSSYLLHFPLQLAVAVGFAASGRVPAVGSAWFLIAYLGVTLILSRLVFERFERPAQDWIRQYAARRRTALA